VLEFHAEAPQATVSEGLAQGLYVVARARVKPMTLWTKGVDSTNAPLMPHLRDVASFSCACDQFQCMSFADHANNNAQTLNFKTIGIICNTVHN